MDFTQSINIGRHQNILHVLQRENYDMLGTHTTTAAFVFTFGFEYDFDGNAEDEDEGSEGSKQKQRGSTVP